jgi:hypothetical protein
MMRAFPEFNPLNSYFSAILAYGKTENGKETVGIIPVLAWRG